MPPLEEGELTFAELSCALFAPMEGWAQSVGAVSWNNAFSWCSEGVWVRVEEDFRGLGTVHAGGCRLLGASPDLHSLQDPKLSVWTRLNPPAAQEQRSAAVSKALATEAPKERHQTAAGRVVVLASHSGSGLPKDVTIVHKKESTLAASTASVPASLSTTLTSKSKAAVDGSKASQAVETRTQATVGPVRVGGEASVKIGTDKSEAEVRALAGLGTTTLTGGAGFQGETLKGMSVFVDTLRAYVFLEVKMEPKTPNLAVTGAKQEAYVETKKTFSQPIIGEVLGENVARIDVTVTVDSRGVATYRFEISVNVVRGTAAAGVAVAVGSAIPALLARLEMAPQVAALARTALMETTKRLSVGVGAPAAALVVPMTAAAAARDAENAGKKGGGELGKPSPVNDHADPGMEATLEFHDAALQQNALEASTSTSTQQFAAQQAEQSRKD